MKFLFFLERKLQRISIITTYNEWQKGEVVSFRKFTSKLQVYDDYLAF